MHINMKPGFMYWGITEDSFSLELPYPTSGTFETSRKSQTQESADGSVVFQLIGRSRDKQKLAWEIMDPEKWWEINNWLETNGVVFFCKYFNFNRGIWQTKKFYAENPTCTPYRPNGNPNSASYGMPRFLQNCELTIIDMGGE